MSRERSRAESGFTLIELLVALTVMALLAGALAVPVAARLQARRFDDARRQLELAGDALLTFAAAHGRLPCPATATSRGEEAFAAAADAATGECATFHGGFLPAATLGLAGLDGDGLLRDPWDVPSGRVRYAVASATVNGVPRALTRRDGVRTATLAGLADVDRLLFVCASGAQATASGCGPAVLQLTRRAVFVVVAPGPRAGLAPEGDEARNLDGDAVFVAHEPSQARGREFAQVVHWASVPLLAHRLIAAGRLP